MRRACRVQGVDNQGDYQGTSGCVNMSHTIIVIIRVAQVSMKGLFLNRLCIQAPLSTRPSRKHMRPWVTCLEKEP